MTSLQDANQNTVLSDAEPLGSQVAGHRHTLGMLSHKNGYVLKPLLKFDVGRRECDFYEEMKTSADGTAKELSKLIPGYHGTVELEVHGQKVKWLVLDDVARDMRMPCVMDVKIGAQTYDPLATEAKRLNEMRKYADCKRDVGFCIPGYQVYDLASGELVKRDRAHGKRLNGQTVLGELRRFLNSPPNSTNGPAPLGLSRSLVLQLLAKLWKILRWFRKQTSYRIYSSSLLLVYDAARLEQHLRNAQSSANVNGKQKPTIGRQLSLRIATGPLTPGHSEPSTPGTPSSVEDWHTVFDKVCKTHSLVHNYERDLQTMKENYGVVLKDLVGRSEHQDQWVDVKMIDFAHVYHSNTDDLDRNYLSGLENLVNIFEQFLLEADF